MFWPLLAIIRQHSQLDKETTSYTSLQTHCRTQQMKVLNIFGQIQQHQQIEKIIWKQQKETAHHNWHSITD
jgi:hypothetical protein